MTKDEMRVLLGAILVPENRLLDVPTVADWLAFESYFGTKFQNDFKYFIELMSEFSFPGDIFNVPQHGRTNGNDDILTVYESELASSDWPRYLVPFYGIGNGDYFAICITDSAVYYRYHESNRFDKYSDSFEKWLEALPEFLNG